MIKTSSKSCVKAESVDRKPEIGTKFPKSCVNLVHIDIQMSSD